MATLRKMPHPSVPLVDAETGNINSDWYLYFKSREQVGLANLSDVSISSTSDGDVLTYNSTSGKWEPA